MLAPWWIQWLVYSALIFTTAGIPVAIVNRHEPGQWLGWWIGIAIVALVVGLVCSLAARSRAPQLRQLLDGLTPGQYRQAAKAVPSGPIPADPAIRRAAARLAQRAVERQFRSISPVLCQVLVWAMGVNAFIQVGSAAFGATISFVTVFNAAVFTGAAVFWWLYPPLLQARAQLLAGPAYAPSIGSGGTFTQRSDAHPYTDRYKASPRALTPHHRYDDVVGCWSNLDMDSSQACNRIPMPVK
ncbi:Uncharacterised protein [Mycobacteroides abscessus subsp. massiliense]|uniref:Transmembrane protein n=3 Tax=Mycobacteroides abscessus TaxID=36809 RepID=A0AB74FER2_9MYCO|nr:Uncharacterised protein [Mycobacteroides abscessus]SHY01417.1 Uncharacterised protein [Mycobacteroides abscessus subsp. abscessus]SKD20664.1 Uncharacterised protein [Mycobacteroides abscessus subsp. massiliense]CPS66050.1 Uncharacterised protein [Mycobacteroides abscessus]CPT25801.1 Uncharacterised protein [Mycobacteroides abscessus]